MGHLIPFYMLMNAGHTAREAKMEALERKIRELEMEKLYKNHRGF